MMNNQDRSSTMVKLLIEKSERNMEQALSNIELGYWDLVANRLYFSVFHAVTALLLADGINTGTHKGTSMQFGRNYVLTGQYSRKDGMLYSKLQTMREKADYQNVFKMSEKEGKEIVAAAKDLQERICRDVIRRINIGCRQGY